MKQANDGQGGTSASPQEDHLRYWLITIGVALALGCLVSVVVFVFFRSAIGVVAFVVVPFAAARIVAQRRRLASNARDPGHWDARIPQDDASRLWPDALKRGLWANLMVVGLEVKDGFLQITPAEGYTQLKIALDEITLDRTSAAFFVSVWGKPIPMFTRVFILRLTTSSHGPIRIVLDERDSLQSALSAALPSSPLAR